MPAVRTFDPERLAPVAVPGIRVLPVVHERVDLAAVVAAALRSLDPAAVAVELPVTLKAAVDQAIRRLPEISAVISEEPREDALVWMVAPGDPLVEALRWARQRGRRSFLIDPDVRYVERHRDPVPDPYALWTLGPDVYLHMLEEGARRWLVTEVDRQRERGMAYHLQEALAELEPGQEILALVGAAHAGRLREDLDGPTARPFARLRRTSVEVRNLHPDSLTGMMIDPPLAHAAFERLRGGELPPEPSPEQAYSRRISLIRHGLKIIAGEKDEQLLERKRSLPDLAACQAAAFLESSTAESARQPAVDRRRLGLTVFQVAAGSQKEQTQEEVAPWQGRVFRDFARRYARQEGLLVPGLFEWVVAGRGVADDNFAWEVFDAARTYPWQQETSDLPTARLDGEHLDLGTRRVRFRRHFFRVKQRPVRVPVRQREQTDDPERWIEGFDDANICSYPKEDLIIEDYARFLQRKAISMLTVENRRSEPFSTSLLDGLDVRETLRNLHEGRVYVQQLGRAPGAAGSVVVIFERDLEGSAFPYTMTWHGEHTQESDMAFYATNPLEQVVGPGITRATYGGFLMSYPPGRLAEVWQDRDYRFAREKSEVLVMAAVDYSEEKLVVHVARDVPSQAMKNYAAAQGKRLLHIPLGSLSPVTLRKVRVVHMLAGRDKREIANRYIW